eukprot:386285_1
MACRAWQLVGQMPEPAINPRLKLNNTNKVITVKQRYRHDMDYWFEFDLNTNQCIKHVQEGHQQNIDYVEDHSIKFDIILKSNQSWNLCILKSNQSWYSTPIPSKQAITSYIISPSARYILLFGMPSIFICDTIDRKWYESAIQLPPNRAFISPIIVPNMQLDYDTAILYIVSYWNRNIFKHKLCPREVSDIIITYYPNFVLYIFGGIQGYTVNMQYGNGYNDDIIGLCDIYKIDLFNVLQNTKDLNIRFGDKIVDTKQIEFYDVRQFEFEECCVCYGPTADCLVAPCHHVCLGEDCMEENFAPFVDACCPLCNTHIQSVYKIMY